MCDDLPTFEPEKDAKLEITESKANRKPPEPKKQMKQTTLFGTIPGPKFDKTNKGTAGANSGSTVAQIAEKYAQQFPKKIAKPNVRVEARLVCIVRLQTRSATQHAEQQENALYLVQQRPDKGLLASLWEFPTVVLQDQKELSEDVLLSESRAFVQELTLPPWSEGDSEARYLIDQPGTVQCLGRVKHTFSHLQWDMHVCLMDVHENMVTNAQPTHQHDLARGAKWIPGKNVERLAMGTGLRRCWSLVSADA